MSERSADLAARLGASFCFSEHHRLLHDIPVDGAKLIARYVNGFCPSPELSAPQTVVALSGVCADTDADAEELLRLEAIPGADPRKAMSLFGGIDRCTARIQELTQSFGVNELAVLPMILNPKNVERCERMLELLSKAFHLAKSA
jgi:alkanesulfonate monooxygenase SsuD/methylene tetrahydromethanopterin reductase-like flavin-dependent oxidoreductase (luciferase family)